MVRKRASTDLKTPDNAKKNVKTRKKDQNSLVYEVRIGEKVRQLRKSKGLSIQKLADLSGVSPAGVYKIETNGMVPTVTTLVKLARALERRVTYFMEEDTDLPEVSVIRKKERTMLASGQEGKTEVLTEKLRRGTFEGLYRTLESGARTRNVTAHAGEEHLVYCLKGELSIFRGEETFRLKEGDALHCQSNGHLHFENKGKSAAQFLLVHAPLSSN
ncbi:MAG: XRE family transcriptional regulator [bacterium]|nr:XRE family transcriptional regulator [bacterium]